MRGDKMQSLNNMLIAANRTILLNSFRCFKKRCYFVKLYIGSVIFINVIKGFEHAANNTDFNCFHSCCRPHFTHKMVKF